MRVEEGGRIADGVAAAPLPLSAGDESSEDPNDPNERALFNVVAAEGEFFGLKLGNFGTMENRFFPFGTSAPPPSPLIGLCKGKLLAERLRPAGDGLSGIPLALALLPPSSLRILIRSSSLAARTLSSALLRPAAV